MPRDLVLVQEPYRAYLEVLARVHFDPRLRDKVEPSDFVQQVMLRAFAGWSELKDSEPFRIGSVAATDSGPDAV